MYILEKVRQFKLLILLLLTTLCFNINAKEISNIEVIEDSMKLSEKDSLKMVKQSMQKEKYDKLKNLTRGEAVVAWHVQEPSAVEIPSSPDTLHLNYQIATTPVYLKHISAEWLGNLGLPAQAAVYSERTSTKLTGDNIFAHSYSPYYLGVEDVYFYNTRVPYTNISYYTGGYTHHGEDHLTGMFTANVNQRLNLGLCFDYIYGRGSFYNQASDGLTGAFNLSYRGEKYSVYFIAGLNNFKNKENGGLQNDADLKNFEDSYTLKVNLTDAQSTLRSYYFWMDHQYHMGYSKMDPDDSEKETFVPLSTLSYTFKFEGTRKRYYEGAITPGFYKNNYYSNVCTRDTTSHNYIRNVLSITFNEGYKPWMVFSLRAFAEADVEEHMYMIADSAYNWETKTKVSVGGELFKRKGNTTFGVLGEVLLIGSKNRLAFNVTGDFNSVIPLKTCSLTIKANGHVKSINPSFYQERYYSNHFIWDKTFNNTWDARGYGKVGIPNKWVDFEVGAGWQGLKQYIYFDYDATPTQCNDFIQIISGEASVNFHIKWFNWENRAVIQYASHPKVVPLPLVSAFSNIYADFTVVKVLNIQIGVDCRYNTSYYANSYMPATGQFYVQNQVLCGNYPEMNLYANFKLKKFRFFVMWYNFSSLFMQPTYFMSPHYPLNPSMVKIGLSWNFFD